MALISMPRCEPTADIEFLCPSHPEKAVFAKIYFGIAKLFVDKMCVLHINPTITQSTIINFCCRPPHGGRGLKFHVLHRQKLLVQSPSSRRAWIEILNPPHIGQSLPPSPSSRRAWIEIHMYILLSALSGRSPSSRRAWIEITASFTAADAEAVALLTEGVD